MQKKCSHHYFVNEMAKCKLTQKRTFIARLREMFEVNKMAAQLAIWKCMLHLKT